MHAQIAMAVALIAGFVASHATAWLTHVDAPSSLKAKVAILLTAVAGVVATVGWAPHQSWYGWVESLGFALLGSQTTYLLKDVTGVGYVQKVGLKLGQPKRNRAARRKPVKRQA